MFEGMHVVKLARWEGKLQGRALWWRVACCLHREDEYGALWRKNSIQREVQCTCNAHTSKFATRPPLSRCLETSSRRAKLFLAGNSGHEQLRLVPGSLT